MFNLNNNAYDYGENNEINKLSQGQISIPVHLETETSLVNDPTLSNYETPLFLSKNQRTLNAKGLTMKVSKSPLLTPQIVNSNAQDINNIKRSLSATKTYHEKLRACNILY